VNLCVLPIAIGTSVSSVVWIFFPEFRSSISNHNSNINSPEYTARSPQPEARSFPHNYHPLAASKKSTFLPPIPTATFITFALHNPTHENQ
jgi:hypothetical protein